LDDSDFVENVLKSTEEALEEKYELKARGYNFDFKFVEDRGTFISRASN
jgi:hypothetical protein